VVLEERRERAHELIGARRPSTCRFASAIAFFAAIDSLSATWCVAPAAFLSGTMYADSVCVSAFSSSASRAISRSPPRLASFARSRRASSSASGWNAFVHVSTADVRVSMKFSSSGKGVPSP
jgi:hypothetical protein